MCKGTGQPSSIGLGCNILQRGVLLSRPSSLISPAFKHDATLELTLHDDGDLALCFFDRGIDRVTSEGEREST